MINIIKKEFVGFFREYSSGCYFESETETFYIPYGLLNRLLGVDIQNGDKLKISIEVLSE